MHALGNFYHPTSARTPWEERIIATLPTLCAGFPSVVFSRIPPCQIMTLPIAACASQGTGGPDTELGESRNLSPSVGRACGFIFATALIRSFSASTAPLLVDSVEGMEAAEVAEPAVPLQPQQPSPLQAETYKAFCNSSISKLRERVTGNPGEHETRFTVQDDERAQSMMRTGVPLRHFEERWGELPSSRARRRTTRPIWTPSTSMSRWPLSVARVNL